MNNARNIEALIVLAEELHFSRAASRLLLTQPAMSRRIQALEAEVGATLVRRTTRGVMLTPIGEEFAAKAREAMGRLETALADAKAQARGVKGTLTIGYNRTALNGPFGRMVRMFREGFPNIQLDLQFTASHRQIEKVSSGALDCGFMIGEAPAELAQVVVDREKLVAVLPESYPLRAGAIRLASLKDESFVFGERLDWRSFRRFVDDECRKVGFLPNVTQEAATAEAVFSLVAVGAGVSLYLRRHGEWPGIVYSDLEDCDAHVETRMIWREDEGTPQLRSFLHVVKGVLADPATTSGPGRMAGKLINAMHN